MFGNKTCSNLGSISFSGLGNTTSLLSEGGVASGVSGSPENATANDAKLPAPVTPNKPLFLLSKMLLNNPRFVPSVPAVPAAPPYPICLSGIISAFPICFLFLLTKFLTIGLKILDP